MSTATTKITTTERVLRLRAKRGLSDKEQDFLDKLHTCARLVATPHLSRQAVIEKLIECYPGTNDSEAKRWVRRAREYIAMGFPDDALRLRGDYFQKLESLIATCSEHVVRDISEVTVISEVAEGKAADGTEPDLAGKPKQIKKKVQSRVFNNGAAMVMLKALRLQAEAAGVVSSGKRGPASLSITTNTINAGAPGRRTGELTNDALLDLLGLDAGAPRQLLQDAGAQGRPSQGVQAPVEVIPEGDRRGHGD